MDTEELADSNGPEEPQFETAGVDVGAQLTELVEKHRAAGNALFAQENWEAASKEFTMALKFARGDRETAATMLSNRSAALCSWSIALRSRPAALSERRAIYAPDPTHLAQLALRDAEKTTQLKPAWHKGYSRAGAALFLLERYPEAEAAYLEGLLLAPGNAALTDGLQKVQAVLAEQQKADDEAAAATAAADNDNDADAATTAAAAAAPRKRQRRVIARDADDTECVLCMKLLCEPVTTPCGHTFCRSCLSRALDHSSKCPCCRTVIHVARELPVSITLKNILAKSFPEEYAERIAEERAAAAEAAGGAGSGGGGEAAAGGLARAGSGSGGGGAATLPLFVMQVVLPGEKIALNIFEPRYRLMVRRCMEGSHLLGMAQVRSGFGLDPIACEAAITECQQLPDGRYYLELTGRRRVRIGQQWEQDGYRVAEVVPMRDDPPAAGTEEETELRTIAAEVEQLADGLMARVRSYYSGRRLSQLMNMLERVGDKPSPGDPEALSWWIGRILLVFAPDGGGALRDGLLTTESTLTRLREERRVLQARLDGAGSCAVQ